MNKNLKRIISIFLSIIMIFMLGFSMAGTALACDGDEDEGDYLPSSGSCGKNATFTFNSDTGALVIKGTGTITYCFGDDWDTINTITIEEGITGIERDVFAYTEAESIIVPDSVKKIGDYAFAYCSNLKSIYIGSGVEEIGNGILSACYKMESCEVSVDNPYFSALDGVLFNKDQTRLISFSSNKEASYDIPQGVIEISPYAFYDCKLTSLTIPDTVVSIGTYAFFRCKQIESLTIPDSVSSIDKYAFSEMRNLKTIVLPAAITSIKENSFSYCDSLTSVIIPEGVTSIEKSAFYKCSALSSVTLPEGLISIGKSAFYKCSALSAISLPAGLTSIGESAFFKCKKITEIVIPDGLTEIMPYTFLGCSKLTTVTGGNCLAKIGEEAFYGSGLVNIDLPDSLVNIDDDAFYGCKIENIKIPDGITTINYGTFHNCDSLTTIVISDSVTKIGQNAFDGCSRLDNVTLGNKVTSIGERAFYGCAFESIQLPDSLKKIGELAFGKTNLRKIQIPANVASIGEGAFSASCYLEGINVESGNTTYCTVSGVLFNKAKTVLISYPCNLKKNSYTVPYGVEKIGGYAFYGCPAQSNIILSDTVREIGSHAFSAVNLKMIELPDTIEKIGEYAFGSAKIDSFNYNGTTKQWWKVNNRESAITSPVICTNGTAWIHDVMLDDYCISGTAYVYDGKVKKPYVSMKNAVGAYLNEGTDFKVSYSSGRKNVGKYTVTITYLGDYEKKGTQTLSFTIVPKGTSITSLSASSKAFTVKWSKQTTQTTGYQVRYSRNSSMSSAKTVTISKNTSLSKKVTGLPAKKKYYVQVRTYKSVNGTKYYSNWSTKKSVTTK